MSSVNPKAHSDFAEIYGGIFGGTLPLFSMIIAIVVLAATGMRSSYCYWCAGYLTIIVGFFVFKDKKRFQAAVIDGVKNPIFAFMMVCFLFAGVMAKILTTSHLIDSLLWLLTKIHVTPGLMPLICFFIAAILSTATGSAAASNTASTPVLVPLAVTMGCNPALICGAILSGGCFGDNLAPISDTTIASSLTQEVSAGRVVKSRLKYSLIAGAVSAIAFTIMGISTTTTSVAESLQTDATYASSLLFLVVPILVIVLMLNKCNLLTSLLISEIVGIVMLFAYGYMDYTKLVAKDGLLVTGFSGMLGSIIFIMFIFVMVSLLREAGVLDAILHAINKYAKSERSAEIASGAMVSIMSIAISSGTTAITCCGPIIRSLMRPFKIDRARSANILDGLGCGIGYLVPTNAGCLNIAALAVASGAVAEGFNSLQFVTFNFHAMALAVVFWFAILSGWGRKHETDEELAADGIVIEDSATK